MIGEVGRCHGMAGRSRDRDRHLVRGLASSGMRRDRRLLRDAGLDLTSNPCPSDLDRLSWPTVHVTKLEERQQVFCTICGPRSE